MLRIISHIERLLLVHDCVIIPKVGGFVLQNHTATFSEKRALFTPASKEVVFNQSLQHNDGLLTESYMHSYNVKYNQAVTMLDKDIESLRSKLSLGNTLMLGHIGSLSMEQNVLHFYAASSTLFSIASYGLASFNMPLLKSLQQTEMEDVYVSKIPRNNDTIYIPINRRFLRTAVASAAAVALFLLIPSTVNQVGNRTFKASMLPLNLVSQITLEAPMPQIATSIELNVSTAPKIVIEQKVEHAKPQKMYHLVIGSFPTEDEAKRFTAKLEKASYPNYGSITRQGRIRVYAAKFKQKSDAEAFLSELRQNKKYQDAWLYAAK